MRRVTVIAVVSALLSPGVGFAGEQRSTVLVIQPNDPARVTPFRTVVGRSYRFTVSGMYLYDGKFGRADCGHRDPPDHTTWMESPNFVVDGEPAACVFQPYDQTHTYQWTQAGTGAAFTIDIPGGSYDTTDDLGPLVVAVASVP